MMLNVYVWKDVRHIVGDERGGVLVVASELKHARKALHACVTPPGAPSSCTALFRDPDYVFPTIDSNDELVLVFPLKEATCPQANGSGRR